MRTMWSRKSGSPPPYPTRYPMDYPPQQYPQRLQQENNRAPKEENIVFDAKKHLHYPLQAPPNIHILQQEDNDKTDHIKLVKVPSSTARKPHVEDLAYTEPFRVLSDEGVRAFKSIIQTSEEQGMAIETPRNPKIIRGLGFTSAFVKDFNESPELLDHLSTFANVQIAAHPMTTNYSQINFGNAPKEGETEAKPADVWHLDSVDYVLVISLTDGFKGGELLVSNMDPNHSMECIRRDSLPEESILRNVYGPPGYGIFMQGSRIAHSVAPVLSGATRITVVNSYASCDPSRIDRPSIYNALAQNHMKEVYDPDYLRCIAWRCLGKLNHLVSSPSYDNLKEGEELLELVIDQLCTARDLMKGEKKFDVPLSTKVNLDHPLDPKKKCDKGNEQ